MCLGLKRGVRFVVQLYQHHLFEKRQGNAGLDSTKHIYTFNNRQHERRTWALKFWYDEYRQGLNLCGK